MTFSSSKRLILTVMLLAASALFPLRPASSAAQESRATLSRPLHMRWSFEADNISNITPAFNEEAVYVPLGNGAVVSLRRESGELSWRSDLGGVITSTPSADSRGVYLASEIPPSGSKYPQATGVLRALGGKSGVTLWMRTLPSPIRGALAANDTTLFGRSSDGRIYAVTKENGEIAWIKYGSLPFNTSPVLYGRTLYVVDTGGSLYAIDESTGQTSWRYRTRAQSGASLAIIEGTV